MWRIVVSCAGLAAMAVPVAHCWRSRNLRRCVWQAVVPVARAYA